MRIDARGLGNLGCGIASPRGFPGGVIVTIRPLSLLSKNSCFSLDIATGSGRGEAHTHKTVAVVYSVNTERYLRSSENSRRAAKAQRWPREGNKYFTRSESADLEGSRAQPALQGSACDATLHRSDKRGLRLPGLSHTPA